MKDHFQHCSKNVFCTSRTIQNKLITLAGDDVKIRFLHQLEKPGSFQLWLMNVGSAIIEQMSCIRYVGASGDEFEVREEFIRFVDLEKVDAGSISSKIVEYLMKCELDLCNLYGQGYDGATVMSIKGST